MNNCQYGVVSLKRRRNELMKSVREIINYMKVENGYHSKELLVIDWQSKLRTLNVEISIIVCLYVSSYIDNTYQLHLLGC